MVNLIYAFLIILALKFVINLSRYLKCQRYLEVYKRNFKNPNSKIIEQSSEIVQLFKDAGVKDVSIPLVEPVGYGKIYTTTASIFDNIAVARGEVVEAVMRMFYQSIGVYKSRMWETINPLYWIETIIYLPKRILSYLGIPPEKRITNILQVVYWVLSGLVTLALTVFQPEIQQIVKGWLSK